MVFTICFIAELRQAKPHTPIGNPWLDFLMVIMANEIAHGCVRRTTQSRNTAAKLQIIGWQRPAAFVYRVLLWHWASMLSSIDNCQNKVSADQHHVTIPRTHWVYSSSRSRVFWSWPLFKCWFLDWIRLTCWKHDRTCWKHDGIVRKPVNANPGLKVTEV